MKPSQKSSHRSNRPLKLGADSASPEPLNKRGLLRRTIMRVGPFVLRRSKSQSTSFAQCRSCRRKSDLTLNRFPHGSDVQMLRLEVCIATQHLPILVPGNESDLLNRKACFEKPACAFVAQVVEVKVFDLEFSALAAKGCTDRLSIVWKYTSAITFRQLMLFLNNCARVISTNVQ